MRVTILVSSSVLFVLELCLCASALAQDPSGTWLVAEQDARVRVGPCGQSLCGWISWLEGSTSLAAMGQRVLWDLKEQADGSWRGKAFNPRDGETYAGSVTVSGATLTMKGCVLGGLFCKSSLWTRVE
jgi:uncharacterized protein (DUF2147 family)